MTETRQQEQQNKTPGVKETRPHQLNDRRNQTHSRIPTHTPTTLTESKLPRFFSLFSSFLFFLFPLLFF